MKRYFFDYTATDQSLCDYRGDEFSSLQSAIEFAAATAQVLKNSLSDDWTDWSIEIRSAEGQKYFSVPVAAAVPVAP